MAEVPMQTVSQFIREHGGMRECPSCVVGSPSDEWKQEGDGWRCPDCGANLPELPGVFDNGDPANEVSPETLFSGLRELRQLRG